MTTKTWVLILRLQINFGEFINIELVKKRESIIFKTMTQWYPVLLCTQMHQGLIKGGPYSYSPGTKNSPGSPSPQVWAPYSFFPRAAVLWGGAREDSAPHYVGLKASSTTHLLGDLGWFPDVYKSRLVNLYGTSNKRANSLLIQITGPPSSGLPLSAQYLMSERRSNVW